MCIAYLSLGAPEWPLLIAANRDEFHTRPTQAAGPWPLAPHLIAGRDLLGGGTWMGMTEDGRYALLTNYREPGRPAPPGAPSRGLLVRDFLLSQDDPAAWIASIAARADDWAGFNLIVGDTHQAWYLGNRDPARTPRRLEPGRYVLSNHLLDTPWPKAARLRAALDALPPPAWAATPEIVLERLRDTTPAADARLPATGLSLERERLLSSPFIISPDYGTRCSTVLTRAANGRFLFCEQGYDAAGRPFERHDWRL
ncbi:MAG: NRDE family protein [Castellaniella sp.]|uniref:NRDE family protein n=1 Tax=Castellaniella sp. TaxID=1955812 RepID=UPI002A371D89|nr:NRDE family protein [Castellaniella sp.]MDY0309828.1 NRDE family protein [Castellaniella sp.]